MKANDGVPVIDDFGRQLISPARGLLVPDYGVRFDIRFEVMCPR